MVIWVVFDEISQFMIWVIEWTKVMGLGGCFGLGWPGYRRGLASLRAVLDIPVLKLLRAPTSHRSIGAGAMMCGLGGGRKGVHHRGFVSLLRFPWRASAA